MKLKHANGLTFRPVDTLPSDAKEGDLCHHGGALKCFKAGAWKSAQIVTAPVAPPTDIQFTSFSSYTSTAPSGSVVTTASVTGSGITWSMATGGSNFNINPTTGVVTTKALSQDVYSFSVTATNSGGSITSVVRMFVVKTVGVTAPTVASADPNVFSPPVPVGYSLVNIIADGGAGGGAYPSPTSPNAVGFNLIGGNSYATMTEVWIDKWSPTNHWDYWCNAQTTQELTAGSYPLSIEVYNHGGVVTINPISVIAVQPPQYSYFNNYLEYQPTFGLDIGGAVGQASASDAVSWTISDNTHFLIDSSGNVTAKVYLEGSFSFTVTAHNTAGSATSPSIPVVVNARTAPPVSVDNGTVYTGGTHA